MVKEKISRQPFAILFMVLLILYCLSLVIPFIWVILSSLKTRVDFILNPFGLPGKYHGGWEFRNYIDVFEKMFIKVSYSDGRAPRNVYLPEMFLNSLVYAIACTFVTTLSYCVTAYVVAKYKFFFGKVLYSTVIVTMIIPIVGNLPSMINLMSTIGFYDNVLGLVIMKASFTGTNFLIFYATFKGISWEYAEAAFIDGASHVRVMFTIMLPLAKVTILALSLMTFIGIWNDWQTSMIYLPSFPMAAYGLYVFQFSNVNAVSGTNYLMAACALVVLPILLLFIAFRNKLMGAVAVGGLKG